MMISSDALFRVRSVWVFIRVFLVSDGMNEPWMGSRPTWQVSIAAKIHTKIFLFGLFGVLVLISTWKMPSDCFCCCMKNVIKSLTNNNSKRVINLK